jgi:hypothetical protein
MPMDATERRMLDAVSLDAPWELVKAFSRVPRWMPEDVNRAGEAIAERLRRFDAPVTVHEPEIYLAVPLSASVEAGDTTHRAKPPTSGLPVPEGRTAPLVHLSTNPKALRLFLGRAGPTLRSACEAKAALDEAAAALSGGA